MKNSSDKFDLSIEVDTYFRLFADYLNQKGWASWIQTRNTSEVFMSTAPKNNKNVTGSKINKDVMKRLEKLNMELKKLNIEDETEYNIVHPFEKFVPAVAAKIIKE